jgi:hypothetical protein
VFIADTCISSAQLYDGFDAIRTHITYFVIVLQSGIYHHTGLQDGFNPFEITNHAVLAVGYGADPVTKEKFWIVKNSWSAKWGEKGYFRIRRDSDECAIESCALASYGV